MIDFIYIPVILFTSLIYHELGHYAVHLWYDREPKLYIFSVTYNLLPENKKQIDRAIIAGILIGFIPILISAYFAVSIYSIIFVLVVYIISCKHDFKQLKGEI